MFDTSTLEITALGLAYSIRKIKKYFMRVRLVNILTHTVLVFWALVCMFPLYWVAVTSLKGEREIVGGPLYLPFLDFTPSLDAWRYILVDSNDNLLLRYFNSSVVGLTATLLTVVLAGLAVYGLTRFRFALRWTALVLGFLLGALVLSLFFVSEFSSQIPFAIACVLLLFLALRLHQYSPQLADALTRGKLDVAFMRPEAQTPELVYGLVTKEPLVVVLPSDYRLAARDAIDPHDIVGETFVSVSNTAPALRVVIDDYLQRSKLGIRPDHEVDNLAMAMSLIASTRGVALLPAYAQNFMPWSVTSRPIKGDVPTIDLVIGYHRANTSPTLKLFLSRVDDLIVRVSKKLSDHADGSEGDAR